MVSASFERSLIYETRFCRGLTVRNWCVQGHRVREPLVTLGPLFLFALFKTKERVWKGSERVQTAFAIHVKILRAPCAVQISQTNTLTFLFRLANGVDLSGLNSEFKYLLDWLFRQSRSDRYQYGFSSSVNRREMCISIERNGETRRNTCFVFATSNTRFE